MVGHRPQEFPVAMGARMANVGNRLLESAGGAFRSGPNSDLREVPRRNRVAQLSGTVRRVEGTGS